MLYDPNGNLGKYILVFVFKELIQEEAAQEMSAVQDVLNEVREKVCNLLFVMYLKCSYVHVY